MEEVMEEEVDNRLLEPRAERIARYKAERRRELAERFGAAGELPSKWGRREGDETDNGPAPVAGATAALNGRARYVANGYEEESATAGSAYLRSSLDDGPTAIASSLDLAVKPGAATDAGGGAGVGVGRRRTRRYLPSGAGGGRKTGERFRTQPITANEMQESSGLLEAEEEENAKADVKTDARAKMSVAAKMSLFKELEKTSAPESSAFLKPRSGSVCHERRSRHGNEHRFLTQPITCEEMVAISASTRRTQEEGERQEEDESCRLSMSQKLALFNNLSLPGSSSSSSSSSQGGRPTAGGPGPPERRRQKGPRYRTQPITVEEVSLVKAAITPQPQSVISLTGGQLQKGPVQLPAFCLAPHLSDRQQALSVNLKPSELRLSTPDISPAGPLEPGAIPGPGPGPGSLPRSESEPVIRSILKKSSSSGVAWRPGAPATLNVRGVGGPGAGQQEKRGEEEDKEEKVVVEEEEVVVVTKRSDAPLPLPPPRERSRRSAAPWRQRGPPAATEASVSAAGTPERPPPADPPGQQGETRSSSHSSRPATTGGHREEEEAPTRGQVRVTLAEGSTLMQQTQPATDTKEENDHSTLHQDSLRWDPVFASVYSRSTPQYVMCFNQSNLSFEAQEVTSPAQAPPRPRRRQRQKVPGPAGEEDPPPPTKKEEKEGEEEEGKTSTTRQDTAEGRASTGESKESDDATPVTEVTARLAKRGVGSPDAEQHDASSSHNNQRPSAGPDTRCPFQDQRRQSASQTGSPQGEEEEGHLAAGIQEETDGCFHGDRSPPSACVPLGHSEGGAATESQQDLGVFCQTSTSILSSAVTEHRRAVRPSRRSQGSRNPLRALAAREDINQDHMGDRGEPGEESAALQAQKKAKNSHSRQNSKEKAVSSSDDVTDLNHAPFKSPMLLQIKGWRQVQTRLVEPSASSLNSGDCFLLVTRENCILWSGEFANAAEKAKALELASDIQRHRDLGCQAPQLLHLEEGLSADSSLAADFWSLLGGRRQYRGAGPAEEDQLYEGGVVESNCVYRLLDQRLVPQEQAWAAVPSVSLLGPAEALVFDFGSEVYLWYGKDVPLAHRKVALQLAEQVWGGAYDYSNCRVNPLDPANSKPSIQLRGTGRPSWALFGSISQHSETAIFREKFLAWPSREEEPLEAPAPQTPAGLPSVPSSVTPSVLSSVPSSVPPSVTPSVPPSVTPSVPPSVPPSVTPSVTPSVPSSVTPSVPPSVTPSVPSSVTPTVTPSMPSLVLPSMASSMTPQAEDTWTPCDAKALLSGKGVPTRDPQTQTQTLALDAGRQAELETVAVETWHVQESGGSEVPVATNGQLHEGESYVVRWTYTAGGDRKEKTAYFLWHGRHSSVGGRGTATFLSVGLKSEEDSQMVVQQGQEPPCFLQLFRGGLVTHRGRRDHPPPASTAWRMFCVSGQLLAEASLLEVDCLCSGLRSRGAVVLLGGQQGAAYLWHGCKAHASAREVGKRAVECLSQNSSNPLKVQVVEEGSEPAEFWTALGQQDRKAYDCMLQDPGKYNFTPRLFHLSACEGVFQGEELHGSARLPGVVTAMPFVQESLYSAAQPALFLLDNRLEVYLWQRGPLVAADSACSRWANERRCAMQTTLQYCKELNPRRPPMAYLISEGAEPLTFTNVFPRWERRPRPATQADPGQAKLVLVQDALAQLPAGGHQHPGGTDPRGPEVFLPDQDFQAIPEAEGEQYESLAAWKQGDAKTGEGLYV